MLCDAGYDCEKSEWYVVCDGCRYILRKDAGPVGVDGPGIGLRSLAELGFGGKAAKACPLPFV